MGGCRIRNRMVEKVSVSLVFDAVWAVVLVGTSRAVAGRLLAVPIGAVISLAAGGAGVAAATAVQFLCSAKARGAGSGRCSRSPRSW